MTKISPDLIRKLREGTGYPVADCKKALEEANGSLEEAINILSSQYASKYDLANDPDAHNSLSSPNE
jgi:translation elongation factor EF-Ts